MPTSNNILEALNDTEVMKYSSFPREGEYIAEATKSEGFRIVIGGYFQKDNDPTVSLSAWIIESYNNYSTCRGSGNAPRYKNST